MKGKKGAQQYRKRRLGGIYTGNGRVQLVMVACSVTPLQCLYIHRCIHTCSDGFTGW